MTVNFLVSTRVLPKLKKKKINTNKRQVKKKQYTHRDNKIKVLTQQRKEVLPIE